MDKGTQWIDIDGDGVLISIETASTVSNAVATFL